MEKENKQSIAVEVTCPHCAAQGQVMVPPAGALFLGRCPYCSEWVALLCGNALPLDREVFRSGSHEERVDHVMSAFIDFLLERVDPLVLQISERMDLEGDVHPEAKEESAAAPEADQEEAEGITADAVQRFIQNDLAQLDDCEYFRRIFG